VADEYDMSLMLESKIRNMEFYSYCVLGMMEVGTA